MRTTTSSLLPIPLIMLLGLLPIHGIQAQPDTATEVNIDNGPLM